MTSTPESLLNQLAKLPIQGASSNSPMELALAVAVVLVEVASLDESLDKFERSIIHSGLQSLFKLSEQEVSQIVLTARNQIATLRGSSAEAQILSDSLDAMSKRRVGQLVDDLLNTHGGPQGFEIFLRKKLRDALGLPDSSAAPL